MNEEIQKAFLSLRVPAERWLDMSLFGQLLALLNENRGAADDIALITSFTVAPLALQAVKERAAILTERIAFAKSLGYGCGINVLATMGHHDENLEDSFQGDYARRTDIQGRVCRGSFCPNDGRFIEDYVIPLYTDMALACPDFIWIDDDVRSGHMPVGPDCYCDCCLEKFAGLSGRLYTRETIAAALDTGSTKEKLAHRKLWLQGKRNTFNRLLETIERTVHGIEPGIALGFMTGERFSDGYGLADQADILAGSARQAVLWRPGCGFYRDDTPREMVWKSHGIGRQVALLPRRVRSIQSEIENFNYEALGKSVAINTTEIASHIAAGCTGTALSVMNTYEDIVAEKTKLFREIHAHRPFYDALVRAQGREPAQGIFTGWSVDSDAAVNLSGGRFSDSWGYNPNYADQWFELGLPMSYSADSAQMAMFSGDAPHAFGEEQLLGWLSKGVYLDGPALETLNGMGYGELTGFRVGGYLDADCIEQFTGRPLNGTLGGQLRDSRQSFWPCPCAVLEPAAAGAQTLARAVDYESRVKAECVMGVFENSLGGRVCVGGYRPWDYVLNHTKAGQCKQIIRWLTRDSLPAYISSLHRANLWVRVGRDGQKVLTLLVSSMDGAEELTIKVLTDTNTMNIYDMRMQQTVVESSGNDGGYKIFRLPILAPWKVYLAIAE